MNCFEEGEKAKPECDNCDADDDKDSGDSDDSGDWECDSDCHCVWNICVMLGLIVIMRTQGCICGGLQICGKKCLGDAQGGGGGARETDVAWTGGGNVQRAQSVTNRAEEVGD